MPQKCQERISGCLLECSCLAWGLLPIDHREDRTGEIGRGIHQPDAKTAHSDRMGAGNIISAIPDHQTARRRKTMFRQYMGEQFRLVIQLAARHRAMDAISLPKCRGANRLRCRRGLEEPSKSRYEDGGQKPTSTVVWFRFCFGSKAAAKAMHEALMTACSVEPDIESRSVAVHLTGKGRSAETPI